MSLKLSNTLCEKQKMLVTSIFSSSYMTFKALFHRVIKLRLRLAFSPCICVIGTNKVDNPSNSTEIVVVAGPFFKIQKNDI